MLRSQFLTRRGVISARSSATAPSRIFTAQLSSNNGPLTFFQQDQLPANTVIRFVPQQTAWVVERMGKFHRYVIIIYKSSTFLY